MTEADLLIGLYILGNIGSKHNKDNRDNTSDKPNIQEGQNLRQDEADVSTNNEDRHGDVNNVEINSRAGIFLISLPERQVEHDKAGGCGKWGH